MNRQLEVGTLDGGEPRTLMQFPVRISALEYVPGHILFVQDGELFARRFDERQLAFTGAPTPILDGIPVSGHGRAPFAASTAGVLAYWPYPYGTPAVLRWFDRTGRSEVAVDRPAQYLGFDLSPDGRRLLASRVNPSGGADLWLHDFTGGVDTRLTFDGAAFAPRWAADGSRVLFSGPGRRPPPKVLVRDLSPGAEPATAAESPWPTFATDWSADTSIILSVHIDPRRHNDLWIARRGGTDSAPLPFNTPASETHGRLSPDGRWIAYVTDWAGAPEVWIASFPSGDLRRQVSRRGGRMPQWTKSGVELVFVSGDNHLMSATVRETSAGLNLSEPEALFDLQDLVEEDRLIIPTVNTYAADSSGRRFLAAVTTRDPAAPPIRIVTNWLAPR